MDRFIADLARAVEQYKKTGVKITVEPMPTQAPTQPDKTGSGQRTRDGFAKT